MCASSFFGIPAEGRNGKGGAASPFMQGEMKAVTSPIREHGKGVVWMEIKVFLFVLLSFLLCGLLLGAPNVPQGEEFDSVITYVNSQGNGKIAVKLALPKEPRYPDGTGILLTVGGFFTEGSMDHFNVEFPAVDNGLIGASLLWPGCTERRSGTSSEGVFDFGGKNCIRALADVVDFLSGTTRDVQGRSVQQVARIPVEVENLGLYAFSHPGIAVVHFLAHYPQSARRVAYFVGGENPTIDKVIAVELGHFNYQGSRRDPVVNPYYVYPRDYGLDELSADYSRARFNPRTGFPYFDVDGNGSFSEGDMQLERRRPSLFNKIVYSADLLNALVDNGELSLSRWPDQWATPDQAEQWWKDRSTAGQYQPMEAYHYELKVMLVFGKLDHVQAAKDKPHVHQMFDGLFEVAGVPWIRLNPDESYVQGIAEDRPAAGNSRPLLFREHPANTQPSNWMDIESWALPPQLPASRATLAGILEMADRTHADNWGNDLSGRLQ